MSISKILIPIDGTELSETVLNPVHRLLAGVGGEVTLVRAIGPKGGVAWPSLRTARNRLLSMVADHEEERIKTDMRLEKGEPAAVIMEQIRRGNPDLVAMATHARTGLPRLLKGSIVETILRSCDVPTLLCNFHGGRATTSSAPYSRILVPLDGSDVAQRVFSSVVDVARAFGSEVILMRVEDGPLHEGGPEYERIIRYLNRFADRLKEAGVETTRLLVASGDPAKTILETVEEERVDLVAMATHGRSGLERLREGSVAEQVLRHCPCPLLVMGAAIPAPEDD